MDLDCLVGRTFILTNHQIVVLVFGNAPDTALNGTECQVEDMETVGAIRWLRVRLSLGLHSPVE